jgi:outer membrane protein assembly factor BamB
LAGSCDGAFHGLDRATGERAWHRLTRDDGALGQIHGDPVLADGLWIAGSHGRYKGLVYAFEPETGEVRWMVRLGEGTTVRLHRFGDTVLAVSLAGEVVALDLATGEERWRLHGGDGDDGLASYHVGDPALADGRLHLPRKGGLVDAIDAATGELLWRTATELPLQTSVLAFDGELLVGSSDGRLARLDPVDGTLLGTFDPGAAGGTVYGYLTATDRCVVALHGGRASPNPEKPEGPHGLVCVRPKDGEVIWERPSETFWTTLRPLVWEGTVVAGTDRHLEGLDAADGTVLWERPVDGIPRGLGASDTHLYVGIRQGRLDALPWTRAADGGD